MRGIQGTLRDVLTANKRFPHPTNTDYKLREVRDIQRRLRSTDETEETEKLLR